MKYTIISKIVNNVESLVFVAEGHITPDGYQSTPCVGVKETVDALALIDAGWESKICFKPFRIRWLEF